MGENSALLWNGERDRKLGAYRPCPCGICSKSRKGVGYLSFSDANGRGFTIWLESETVFRSLRNALRRFKADCLNDRLRFVARENCPPRPDRIELLQQVRRASVDDQLHLIEWLQGKFAKAKSKP